MIPSATRANCRQLCGATRWFAVANVPNQQHQLVGVTVVNPRLILQLVSRVVPGTITYPPELAIHQRLARGDFFGEAFTNGRRRFVESLGKSPSLFPQLRS